MDNRQKMVDKHQVSSGVREIVLLYDTPTGYRFTNAGSVAYRSVIAEMLL